MEPSYQTRKIIGRLLALGCAALLAGAFGAQLTSPLLQSLTARQDTPVRVVFFTKPAMRFSYNPHTRKVVVTLASGACSIEQKEKCFQSEFDFFYIPKNTDQTSFWKEFKEDLSTWRYQPGRVFWAIHAYINARVQHRTDLPLAQAGVLSLELIELSTADFAVEQPVSKKKRGKQSAEKTVAPQPEKHETEQPNKSDEQQPLKVIILNASGKRGQAESLKQYLRAQHAKGLLQVDVYDTGNYPSQQDKSFIEDYSGKLIQVTQISHAIGIRSEIRSAPAAQDAYYDSRIVLGKDFKMPL